ncbi:hypothetical protein M758_5G168200 [Ceratodon purpureus]|uniref:Uncharacterized protein n=1 Tax=Ceratodon purpureus TaxID=3225 RepID=A0A8T0I3W1_CERPU|nr:hypothetical protein KC19_5G175200 [Ceratodon purpureus]KAG0617153.1 hypothetical protein M758_5G168200 [Ceratodon purpureus]
MAGSLQGTAVLLALVMCCIFLQTAADSTIQNAAYAPIWVDGGRVPVGQVVTVQIASGKSTGSVDLAFTRNATGIQIRNSREYFVVVNQSGGTGIVNGRAVRTLDLVEGKRVESSF